MQGADPGFPRGGVNPKPVIRSNFPENCMKTKNILDQERQGRHILYIGGSKAGRQGCALPLPRGPNSFTFMQFPAKN